MNEPLNVQDILVTLTSSFGVAEYQSDAADSLETVLRYAGLALYESKRNGCNAVTPHIVTPA
ncbi:diguanylate cyclase domain-containing protein [Paenibacillus sp. NPDC055715]